MAVKTVSPRSAAVEVAARRDSPEIAALIADLDAARWTGRPGYPVRTMVGMALAKSMYAISTWTRTVRLVDEHAALQTALGCEGAPPSEWACYRFAAKLREHKHLLDACVGSVLDRLHEENLGMSDNVAIDGSDLPAYANGQRFLSKNGPERERYSDPDASWGHRSAVSTRKGGGYYGYKVHAAADTLTGLPVAWEVRAASDAETTVALPLIDTARERGFAVKVAIADKGYDNGPFHDGCMERDVCPITPLPNTPGVVRGDHHTPRRASMASGRSPEPTSSGARRSGAARPASARPPRHGSSRPAAPVDPAPHGTVREAISQPWRGRARVRKAQARMGTPAAPRAWP